MLRLTNLCCQVLANNYMLIESLRNVPDHLGKEILGLIIANRCNTLTAFQAKRLVELFSDSFGPTFLSRYSITDVNSIQLWVPAFASSYCLTALCLDNCELGTTHAALLPTLGSFSGLKQLSVRYNSLCNDSIRAVTAPGRYHKQNPLVVIDVSGNGFLDEKSALLLMKLPSIAIIYLNDTGASVGKHVSPLNRFLVDFKISHALVLGGSHIT